MRNVQGIFEQREVRKLLEQIPDESAFEDIQYHIYVHEKIVHGLNDIEEGRIFNQGEIERRMSSASKMDLFPSHSTYTFGLYPGAFGGFPRFTEDFSPL